MIMRYFVLERCDALTRRIVIAASLARILAVAVDVHICVPTAFTVKKQYAGVRILSIVHFVLRMAVVGSERPG